MVSLRSRLRSRLAILGIRSVVFITVLTLVIILVFGVTFVRVQGRSMAPTIQNDDCLIVGRVPYTWGHAHRGDIVVLYSPEDPGELLIKRLIAGDGDTVLIRDGQVFVNGHAEKDEYVPPAYRDHDNLGPRTIPPGYEFVLGDHRNNSEDSRTLGLIPKRNIVGKVTLRWWPIPQVRLF